MVIFVVWSFELCLCFEKLSGFSLNYNYIHVNGNYMTIYAANMMDNESSSIRKGSIKSVRAYNLTFQILRIKT